MNTRFIESAPDCLECHKSTLARYHLSLNARVLLLDSRNVRSRHRDHSVLRAISGSTFVALRAG
jgi:hypothetical protein